MTSGAHSAHRLASHLAVAAGYVALAQLGFQAATVHPVVASVWPPAGLALAVCLLVGPRCWPGIFVGAMIANGMKGIPTVGAAGIAAGNTLAAVWGVWVLRRLDFRPGLDRVRDALVLLGFGALCAPLIASTIGTAILHLLAGAPAPLLSALWFNWWSGDAIGVMLLAPLLVAWRQGPLPELTGRRGAEIALLGGSLVAASVALLRVPQGYEYAVFPLVSWAAIRFGPRGASAATMIVATVAVWYTVRGVGPFLGSGSDGLWRLQLFLALLTTGSLVLTAMAAAQAAAVSALHTSELRFRRVFEHSAVGIGVVQPDGRMVEANPALRKMLGYPGSELLGRTISEITHPEDMAAERSVLGELLTGQRTTFQFVKRYLRKDGTIFWGKLTATNVPYGSDGPGCAIGLIEDISEQRAAEEALARDTIVRRESEEKLRRTTHTLQTLIDASPLAIYALDARGDVRSWNHAAEQVFGWSAGEVVGKSLPMVPPSDQAALRAALAQVLAGERITGLQVQRCRKDGHKLDLRICAAPTRAPDGTIDGVICLAEDVTERKSLGEQLRQAQKMEAIGQFTGGLAHDFNNILTIIITNAALLENEITPDRSDMRSEVSELQRAAFRGVEMVRKLMAFSRRRPVELLPLDLGRAVRDACHDLRRLLPASVEVTVQVEEGISLTIDGDVGAIEQMLFNLATNARDAMPDGGTLRLRVYRAWLDEEHRRTRGWGRVGEYVVLGASDAGCGMSPKVRARAFEPFFTTKEVGKGTGLGMAMVYGLVTQHKGFVDLHSEEGRGTTVSLYFPPVAAVVQKVGASSDCPPPIGGTERILVVDDEDGVRRSASRVLTRFGYQVQEAADGQGALEILGSAGARFDLVLTDVVMPRMGGMALYQELRRRDSSARVLLMSGHTAEDLDVLDDPHTRVRLLHKPWTITDLLRRVREVLDE